MCENLEFKCKNCGNYFLRTKRELSKNHNTTPVFCSTECRKEWYKKECHVTVSCKNCGKEFDILRGEYNKNETKNFFCSHSCSASFNNKNRTIVRKHKDNRKKTNNNEHDNCPICGCRKMRTSELCRNCRNKEKRNNIKKKTLRYFTEGKTHLTTVCNEIRKDAKRTIEESCKEKVCAYCHNHEYDDILEVHHIKGILKFDKDATISEINDVSNLVWLCPNHHRMLELGLIELKT